MDFIFKFLQVCMSVCACARVTRQSFGRHPSDKCSWKWRNMEKHASNIFKSWNLFRVHKMYRKMIMQVYWGIHRYTMVHVWSRMYQCIIIFVQAMTTALFPRFRALNTCRKNIIATFVTQDKETKWQRRPSDVTQLRVWRIKFVWILFQRECLTFKSFKFSPKNSLSASFCHIIDEIDPYPSLSQGASPQGDLGLPIAFHCFSLCQAL